MNSSHERQGPMGKSFLSRPRDQIISFVDWRGKCCMTEEKRPHSVVQRADTDLSPNVLFVGDT